MLMFLKYIIHLVLKETCYAPPSPSVCLCVRVHVKGLQSQKGQNEHQRRLLSPTENIVHHRVTHLHNLSLVASLAHIFLAQLLYWC